MNQIDGKIKEGIALLFQNYWILRSEHPKEYFFLRGIEKSIRKEITERFGYRVYFTSDFIKLEKLPSSPEPWMGLSDFTSPMDYVLFCCFLSFLEERDTNSYFLLQQICEELKELYPSEPGINWVNRDHRRSLIRVIQLSLKYSLIESIDGDLERFSHSERAEVLYVSTANSRYFMRPYPQNITELASWETLLRVHDGEIRNEVRHNVYRRLFLEPSILDSKVSQAEFYYLRNQRTSIEDYLDRHSDFHLEVFNNFAFLGNEEPNSKLEMFPSQKAIDAIILHLASFVRADNYVVDGHGAIKLSIQEFEDLIKRLHEEYSGGWTKSYRSEKSISEISHDILVQGSTWNFLSYKEDIVTLYPTLALYAGVYPNDFDEKGGN